LDTVHHFRILESLRNLCSSFFLLKIDAAVHCNHPLQRCAAKQLSSPCTCYRCRRRFPPNRSARRSDFGVREFITALALPPSRNQADL